MSRWPSVLLSYVVVDDGKREARTRPCLRTLRGKACEEITATEEGSTMGTQGADVARSGRKGSQEASN